MKKKKKKELSDPLSAPVVPYLCLAHAIARKLECEDSGVPLGVVYRCRLKPTNHILKPNGL